jgi:RNA polymerase sigma-70 factor (ECF subfamily)
VQIDDGGLLELIAKGDESAFDELWRRHAPWLLVRLRRRAPDEAADLVQETFLAAWRNAGSFRGTDAGAWLWTIASRRLIDARRRAASVPSPVEEAPTATTVSSEDEVLGSVLDPRLELALTQLSPELLAALQATVVDGLSTRDAALLLGVAEGTVKSRTSRARAFLRGRLAHPNRPLDRPLEES